MKLTLEQRKGLIDMGIFTLLSYEERRALSIATLKSMSILQLLGYLHTWRAYRGGKSEFVSEILKRKPINLILHSDSDSDYFEQNVLAHAICAYSEYRCGNGKNYCQFQYSVITAYNDWSKITTDYSNWKVQVVSVNHCEKRTRSGNSWYVAECSFIIRFHLTERQLFLLCWQRSKQTGEGSLGKLCKNVVNLIAAMIGDF